MARFPKSTGIRIGSRPNFSMSFRRGNVQPAIWDAVTFLGWGTKRLFQWVSHSASFSGLRVCVCMCVHVCLSFHRWSESEVAQSCLTLCDPMDCSPPGSSVRGILQARILEWVAMPATRGSSWPRGRIQPPALADGFFITSTTWQAQKEIKQL